MRWSHPWLVPVTCSSPVSTLFLLTRRMKLTSSVPYAVLTSASCRLMTPATLRAGGVRNAAAGSQLVCTCKINVPSLSLQGLSSGPVNKAFPKIKRLLNISATGSQHGVITQILYVSKSRQFFAACLDDTLKLYNEHFRLQASFRWHGGVVTQMLYNSLYDELITIGRNGVKAWYCEADYKAFAKNSAAPLNHGSRAKQQLDNSATFASKLKGGKAPPWELGGFQSLRERVTFR